MYNRIIGTINKILNFLKGVLNMAFTTDHEVTVVKTAEGVEFYSSGEKFAVVLNSDGKLHLTIVADVAKSGLTVETEGPSAGKVVVM